MSDHDQQGEWAQYGTSACVTGDMADESRERCAQCGTELAGWHDDRSDLCGDCQEGARPVSLPVLTVAVPGAPVSCPSCHVSHVRWPLSIFAGLVYLACPACHVSVAQLAADSPA